MSPCGPGRFFCTAGRGLEPFLAREVRARLGATEVDCVSGKVFFSAAAGPGELRKLRSGERLFLLLKKHSPLAVTANKGKMLHEIKSLVIEEPKYWLDIISVWRNLHGHEGKKGDVARENPLALKRKSEEETNTASKRQKTEQERDVVSEECQVEAGEGCVVPERISDQECRTESNTSSEDPSKDRGENRTANEQLSFSFRVSCRCSGAIAKILTSQEIGRAVGIALMKQCGWRADLRDPDLEAGAFVLDPMCGLGTILLEAAKEWPEACYWGADISDSQLEGADVNIRTAGLMDKIELLKASVKALPLPSESFDTVISDIPFGKKFKVTNDAQLLPDILQEMERVLRVGGTIVLLLSQDLRKRMDGLTCAGSDSAEAIADGTSETATARGPSVGENPSSVVDGVGESFLSSRHTHFGSLVPDGVYGVSLGKTEAFIYKYRKISAARNQELSGTVLKELES
ncbi:THUMP domain-containing protein 2 isoform X2 [Neopelma chrysocephalum]|uniref:THUMP domain-containing protein 2 isoform X2 n=1 Tax=Neopelma chrysocephalum TaxID=114329 RepID=UPI000FCD2218|nr:THUMP domain-containing protein 2 isoform X2 [Neopelma chrysocephalum]